MSFDPLGTTLAVKKDADGLKERNKLAKQREMTEVAEELAFLIGALNFLGIGFVILRRKKPAQKSLQFLDVLELQGVVQRTQEDIQREVRRQEGHRESVTSETHQRHHHKNKVSVIFNMLRTIAEDLFDDISFMNKNTRSAQFTIKKHTFQRVRIQRVTFEYHEILELGHDVYWSVVSRFQSRERSVSVDHLQNEHVVIPPFDTALNVVMICSKFRDVGRVRSFWMNEPFRAAEQRRQRKLLEQTA